MANNGTVAEMLRRLESNSAEASEPQLVPPKPRYNDPVRHSMPLAAVTRTRAHAPTGWTAEPSSPVTTSSDRSSSSSGDCTPPSPSPYGAARARNSSWSHREWFSEDSNDARGNPPPRHPVPRAEGESLQARHRTPAPARLSEQRRTSGSTGRAMSALAWDSKFSDASLPQQTGRMISFTAVLSRQMSKLSRRDSEDSLLTMTSEPQAFSDSTYVAGDIWLAEKKLDQVESNIIARESNRNESRRGDGPVPHIRHTPSQRRAVASDPFSAHNENVEGSSRFVRMLWSGPAVHDPTPRSRPRAQHGSARADTRGRDKGTAAQQAHEGHFARVSSAGDAHMYGEFDPLYGGRRHSMRRFKAVAKRMDVARWWRRQSHLRAERRDMI